MTIDQQAAGLTTGSALLLQKLSEPFPAKEIGWKPQSVKGSRALALAYIDRVTVMDRLDSVVGPDGWQDRYTLVTPTGPVICRLRVRIGETWIQKADVGGASDQPDAGDRLKSAFSDSLKRAAVKFGIGRYLCNLPQQWADYDPQKKQFVHPPGLPDWALPESSKPSQVRGTDAGKPGTITDVQEGRIRSLLERTGVNFDSFREYYNISEVAYLPQEKYDEAVARLETKLREKNARPAGQPATAG